MTEPTIRLWQGPNLQLAATTSEVAEEFIVRQGYHALGTLPPLADLHKLCELLPWLIACHANDVFNSSDKCCGTQPHRQGGEPDPNEDCQLFCKLAKPTGVTCPSGQCDLRLSIRSYPNQPDRKSLATALEHLGGTPHCATPEELIRVAAEELTATRDKLAAAEQRIAELEAAEEGK
jgi:hypothetical protein